MLNHFRLAFFGSSLVSSYWNGAATYYRGILRELSLRGADITFYEPDAFDRQSHRDIDPPAWAKVMVYPATGTGVAEALESARGADMVVKASGVGVFDEFLEAEVPRLFKPQSLVAFWDVDAPATLDRMDHNPADPFRPLVSQYDLVFTYGGGDPVVRAYRRHGAKQCVPIYNALDPTTHYPVPADPHYRADLAFLGNRLPDREARVNEFFFQAAQRAPERRFLLGGSGWHDKAMPSNVNYIGHVPTGKHNAWNCTPTAVLNISRESMARYGFSPATRVFEAAGAAACIITDAWEGIELFLEPGSEVLVARSGEQVADLLSTLTPDRAGGIGAAAQRRIFAEHTYAQRAEQWERVLSGVPALS